MKLKRQHILALLLGGVALWALFQAFGDNAPPAGAGARPAGAAAAARPGKAAAPDEKDPRPVLTALLDTHHAEEFNPSGGRNLFAYGQPKYVAPPAPPPRPLPPPPPKVVLQAPTPPGGGGGGGGGALEPPPPPPPTPPAVNFSFVGYIGPPEARIGVFNVRTPDGDELRLAGEGEIIAERFRITRIGFEEVEIGYTDEQFAKERKVLPMGGRS